VDEEARRIKTEAHYQLKRLTEQEKRVKMPRYEVEVEEEIVPEPESVLEPEPEPELSVIEEEIEELEDKVVGNKLVKDEKETDDFRVKRSLLRKVKEDSFAVGELESCEISDADKNREKCGEREKGQLRQRLPPSLKLWRASRRAKVGWKWLFLVLFLGLLIPVLVLAGDWLIDIYKSGKSVFKVKELMTERKLDMAEEEVENSLKKVRGVQLKMDNLGVSRMVFVEKISFVTKLLESVLELERGMISLAKNGELMMAAVFGESEFDWPKGLAEIGSVLERVENQSGLLEARLKGGWNWLPSKWRGQPQKEAIEISETRKLVGKMRKLVPVMGEFIGIDGKRRDYLILFQNEMEIRATGGFIGSYGIISFQDGKMLNLEVKDIYGIDGQLKGHVEPPKEIKEILGEANWYMRDANWQADFVASAGDIKWFFKKEAGRDVDGVIGINLAAAKEILSVIGEVYVPDFKEKVDADGLYDQAEFYSESNFFAGSVQKESFLGLLTKQLFEEIKSLDSEKKLNFLKAMVKSLDENEIQVFIDNQVVAEKIADLGWDGSIYDGKCAIDNCLADYLFLVESNLGVNKANYFLYRNIDQVVDIGKKAINRTVRISYENTAKSKAWPGGDYKNYMRVYLPSDVNISELSIYDSDNPTTKKIFRMDELNIRLMDSKKEIGFLVMVPVGKKRTVEIHYLTSVDLTDKDSFSYLNYVQKQSGYGDTPIVSLISFPEGWQPLQVQPAATLVGGKLLFNQKLSSDLKMGVEISK
ncbi:DUF4012 domain-containing protein, partial [Patescibacteria group bacterium]|nr:DUF4012 domain-containing protein [Patescibacteria group bacterium]